MHRSTVYRILRDIQESNSFVPRRQRAMQAGTLRFGRPRKISNLALLTIKHVVQVEATLYLDEIAEVVGYCLNEWYHKTTILYWLKKMKYSRKIVWTVDYSAYVLNVHFPLHAFYSSY